MVTYLCLVSMATCSSPRYQLCTCSQTNRRRIVGRTIWERSSVLYKGTHYAQRGRFLTPSHPHLLTIVTSHSLTPPVRPHSDLYLFIVPLTHPHIYHSHPCTLIPHTLIPSHGTTHTLKCTLLTCTTHPSHPPLTPSHASSHPYR